MIVWFSFDAVRTRSRKAPTHCHSHIGFFSQVSGRGSFIASFLSKVKV